MKPGLTSSIYGGQDGKCALDIAAKHENRECLDVLREYMQRRKQQDESVSSRSYRRPATDQRQPDDFSHFYSNSDVKLKRNMSRTRTSPASPTPPRSSSSRLVSSVSNTST